MYQQNSIIYTHGLTIWERPIGERDRMVRLLTSDLGVVHAFANGSMETGGKKTRTTGMLYYSRLELRHRRENYILSAAYPIEGFLALRGDMVKMSAAAYFCELAGELVVEGEIAEAPLRLTLNTLQFMADGTFSVRKLKAIYELRMLCLTGFMPDLTACGECREGSMEGGAFFCPEQGGLLCRDCRARTGARAMWISGLTLRAMRLICHGTLARIFDVEMPEQDMAQLGEAAERYMICTLQRVPRTLELYRTVV